MCYAAVCRFTEIGEENAYYDPETNEVSVGYELIDSYSQIFEIDENDPEALKWEYERKTAVWDELLSPYLR